MKLMNHIIIMLCNFRMNLIYNILYIFFILNGLFWSLATHAQHCDFAKIFNIKKCPGTHIQHILFGIISLIIGIIIKQTII